MQMQILLNLKVPNLVQLQQKILQRNILLQNILQQFLQQIQQILQQLLKPHPLVCPHPTRRQFLCLRLRLLLRLRLCLRLRMRLWQPPPPKVGATWSHQRILRHEMQRQTDEIQQRPSMKVDQYTS